MPGVGEGVRDGAGGLALDLSRGGAGDAGCGLCAVYEEVLSSARGVFEESERGEVGGACRCSQELIAGKTSLN